jgi:chloramphenicol-sensitive protein RarD
VSLRSGVLFGIAAYGLWGIFPLYFHLLRSAGPVEVLAHRIGWSLLVVAGILVARGRLSALRGIARDRRALVLLAGAAALIAANWGIYIYAVTEGRVLEAALGYFINPLVSVAFGMLVFGERLRRPQLAALGLGSGAVVVLAAYYGGFPWIALALAASFGTYGLLKKLVDVGAPEGLAAETLVLLVPALGYVLLLAFTGEGTFAAEGLGHTLLLVAAGPATAVPLLLFSACVTRVPLTTVGLLMYVTPVLQFLVGWLLLGEDMPLMRWLGFGLVWVALVLLTWDALRDAGASRRARGVDVAATI